MAQAKRKKRFFEVDVPSIRKETHLQAYEPEEIEGKTIKYDLTRLLKGKNVILYLKVKKQDNKFVAHPTKMEIVHSSLGRIVRRGTDYVEDSFLVDCKDYQLRIKLFMITRRKVHRSIRKALRNKAKEEMIADVKDKKSDIIFDELIKNHIQKELSLKLKKIYPLSACEIRVLEVKKPIASENKTE
jgi:ribosomal protein S3AE